MPRPAFKPETGRQYDPGQLDRQFRAIERALLPPTEISAALYIDYTPAIKPGPFAPGAPITFNGGFGYATPEAAFSILAGSLSIPAGNAGAYSLNAAFTLDIGTAATGIIGAHSDGVPIQGLAVAATTSNNPTNTTITVSITGIFPVDETAHTIDIRVMPTSATINVVDAGQFWIKREFD